MSKAVVASLDARAELELFPGCLFFSEKLFGKLARVELRGRLKGRKGWVEKCVGRKS